MRAKTVINPIIDWSDNDVWSYLKDCNCESNPLYKCGFDRVGCIGCPLAGKKRIFEFSVYPKFKQMYINAFDRMLKVNPHTSWKTGEDCFEWWMERNPNQLKIDGFEII